MSETVKIHPDLKKKVDLLFKYLGSQGDNIYEYRFGAMGRHMEEYGDGFVSDSIDIPTNDWLDNIMEELFNIIGKLYVDIYNSQKVLQMLKDQIKQQEQEFQQIKQIRTKDE